MQMDLEKLSLVGALVTAVVILWRAYQSQITLNQQLTAQVSASTEVMRSFTAALEKVTARLDEMEFLISSSHASAGNGQKPKL